MENEYIVWICDGGNRFTRVIETSDVEEIRKCLEQNKNLTTLLTRKVTLEEINENTGIH